MSSEFAISTSGNRIVALYQRSILDPIVELACAVAHDFVKRPRHYKGASEEIAALLENLRFRLGNDPKWPSSKQRSDIFGPLFDEAFRATFEDLRAAAVTITERGIESSADVLEIRVRDAVAAARANLRAVEGRVVASADAETGPIFHGAVQVLRDPAVASVFGLPPAPGGAWPLDGASKDTATGSDGAFLVEELQLALGLFQSRVHNSRPFLTQHLFTVLQRIAHYGGSTIAAVSAEGELPSSFMGIVRDAYNWEKAITLSATYKPKDLAPRVVSSLPLQDDGLTNMPTEEGTRVMAQATGGGGGQEGPKTCLTGWTRVCDTGPSCTYGFTFRCDKGPTCTSGWTIVCDSGPTCTYGWTFKCDKPRAY